MRGVGGQIESYIQTSTFPPKSVHVLQHGFEAEYRKPPDGEGNDRSDSTESAGVVVAVGATRGTVAYHSNSSSYHRVEQYGIETDDSSQL